jgi:tRNA(Arg) A34 adenosine deaminase TadA
VRFPEVEIRLPDWVEDFVEEAGEVFPTARDRMGFVVELSRRNVEHGGGPFGAAVFEEESGRLLAPGVNLVLSANCSVAHAEMVAIMVAQRVLGDFDLGAPGYPDYELVASTEPCAMCLGAAPWSGVRRLLCGARDEDAREIGFDEGVKPDAWVAALGERGITVERDVLRGEAARVLREYARRGGEIYNSRRG